MDEPEREEEAQSPPTEAQQHGLRQRLTPAGKLLGGTLTVAIAAWGAITGTVAWQENRRISVDFSAETYGGYYVLQNGDLSTDEIYVSAVNLSSRAVNLVRGQVFMGDTMVGRIVGGASDSNTGDREPAALPLTLSPDASHRVRLQWRASEGSRRLADLPISKRKLTMRLRLEPGGSRSVPIRTGQVPQQLGGWNVFLTLRNENVVQLELLGGAPSSGPAVSELQVWSSASDRAGPDLAARRPVAYRVAAKYRLSLPRGSYVYSLTADEETVAAESFITPCAGPDGRYPASACTDGLARETASTP